MPNSHKNYVVRALRENYATLYVHHDTELLDGVAISEALTSGYIFGSAAELVEARDLLERLTTIAWPTTQRLFDQYEQAMITLQSIAWMFVAKHEDMPAQYVQYLAPEVILELREVVIGEGSQFMVDETVAPLASATITAPGFD